MAMSVKEHSGAAVLTAWGRCHTTKLIFIAEDTFAYIYPKNTHTSLPLPVCKFPCLYGYYATRVGKREGDHRVHGATVRQDRVCHVSAS